ncbi:MAG: hypothetical protein HKN68_20890, partial [Saprospiraceae bacterium]|nr:hypothetical protein [Saprospiraceae bacterium]
MKTIYKLLYVAFLICFIFSSINSQSSPCDCAQRWDAGGAWVNGVVDDNPPGGTSPLGVARCNNDKESKIKPEGCTYDPLSFLINCSVTPPATGDEVIWINFDARELVSSFIINVKPKGTNDINWALYASTTSQSGTNPANSNGEELSGDCNSLNLVMCSPDESTNVTVIDPDMMNVTNYYIAVWSNDNKTLKEVTLGINDACIDCSDPPVIACLNQVNVSLGVDGTTEVFPSDFLSSAFDPCTPESLFSYEILVPSENRVRNNPPPTAQPSWILDCSLIGITDADIWVSDDEGNWSMCTVILQVEDKLPPSLTCPPDMLIDCDDDISDLNLTGLATAIDNCDASPQISYTDDTAPNGCGGQVIQRTWTSIDQYGNVSPSCTQLITLGVPTPVDPGQVIWPSDIELIACGITPDTVGTSQTGIPVFTTDPCQILAINYSDQVINICPQNYKILRTWTLLDWCTATQLQHIQVIDITCDVAPEIVCIANLNASLDQDGQLMIFPGDILLSALDPCDPQAILDYRIRIGGGVGVPPDNVVILDCSNIGVSSGEVWVGDQAGNWTSCIFNINIEDKLPPAISCPPDVIVPCDADISDLNLTGTATATDNCDPSPVISYT